jgi:uncharacterized membrane protein HdeD (DUF308 family)
VKAAIRVSPPDVRTVRRPTRAGSSAQEKKVAYVIIFGIVLLVVGTVIHIQVLVTIGMLLLVIGVVLWILGSMGRAIGGRKHYY